MKQERAKKKIMKTITMEEQNENTVSPLHVRGRLKRRTIPSRRVNLTGGGGVDTETDSRIFMGHGET